jgi:hypothetical protein
MGANATTFVPSYTSGEVLTAANLSVTNSGIPVFATTVTRDAAFGGTGEKTLAEGQFAYIEATNTTQYYDGAAWQSVGATSGLTLISATTIGTAVSTVTISGAFSSTYDNYKILVSGGTSSLSDGELNLRLGAQTTGYKSYNFYSAYTAVAPTYQAPTAHILIGRYGTDGTNSTVDVLAPNLAKTTFVFGSGGSNDYVHFCSGVSFNNTQFTAFTLFPNTGTLTGGTIYVYGYAKS